MKKLIILTGPTAVGKSELSIKLAKKIDGEIISADSMQVYKGMDIGSAKITQAEMDGVTHHLIDVLNPTDNFDITIFKNLAQNAIDEIYSRGHIPIICGGTGFYIQSLIYDIEFTDEDDEKKNTIRLELEDYVKSHGADALHEMLKEIDATSYELIPANNVKRVIRAIEFFRLNNYPISLHNMEQRQRESAYNFAYFVLNDKRELLYDRINMRVDKMIKQGLVEEVKSLKALGVNPSNTSYNGIGYREIFEYLDGLTSLEQAIDKIKQNSRHYAKRQITWFKRERDVIWLDRTDYINDDVILDYMTSKLAEKGII